jgi:hypothetical protein
LTSYSLRIALPIFVSDGAGLRPLRSAAGRCAGSCDRATSAWRPELKPISDGRAQLGEKDAQRNLVFEGGFLDGVESADRTSRAGHSVMHEQPRRLRPSVHDVIHAVVWLGYPLAHALLSPALKRPAGCASEGIWRANQPSLEREADSGPASNRQFMGYWRPMRTRSPFGLELIIERLGSDR